MTDLVTSFIDVDDDFDMMQFHVSEDETSLVSDWPRGPAQVDWDWASRASSAKTSNPQARDDTSSGFLNCWNEGPLPDIFNLDDDALTTVPEVVPSGTPDSQSEEDNNSPMEVKRSPRSATSRRWTEAEIAALKEAVAQYGTGNWKSIQTDPRYSSLLGDRVRSSLHRKWSRIKVKSFKDNGPVNLGSGPHKSSTRPIPMPISSMNDHLPSSLEASHSPFRFGSWSKESPRPLETRNSMAHSMPPTVFQVQWGANERPPNPAPRTPSSMSVGFQPGSAPHPVHMAVCVDPSAPPRSPFVPPKARFPSSFTQGPPPRLSSKSPSSVMSGLSSSLPKSHGFHLQPIGSPSLSASSSFASQAPAAAGSFGNRPQSLPPSHAAPVSQSVPRSHSVPVPESASGGAKSRRWTAAQAQVLVKAVSVHGESRWRDILNDEKYASFFAGRSPQSLVRKWNRIQSNSAKHLGVPLSEAIPGAVLSHQHQQQQQPQQQHQAEFQPKMDMDFEDSFFN